jgi:DNA-binding XRE family transcriptional regulator
MAYGYRQDKLAEKAHVSPGYLCDLEHGIHKPPPTLARVIADIFGAKVAAVFPDGVAEKICRKRFAPPVPDIPEDPGPRRLYPRRDFGVICWKCKTKLTMRADDYHPSAFDAPPCCPVCRAWFHDIIPLEEAAQC